MKNTILAVVFALLVGASISKATSQLETKLDPQVPVISGKIRIEREKERVLLNELQKVGKSQGFEVYTTNPAPTVYVVEMERGDIDLIANNNFITPDVYRVHIYVNDGQDKSVLSANDMFDLLKNSFEKIDGVQLSRR